MEQKIDMARIRTYKGKYRTTYTATVRVKGYPSISRTFDTKTEAKIWAAEVEAEMRRGRYKDFTMAEKLTLEMALEKYFSSISSLKAERTSVRDKFSINAIKKNFDITLTLNEITPKKVAAYRDRRLKAVTPSTLQKELALLSHLFNVANKEWGIPLDNPVSQIKKPLINNSRAIFLTEHQVKKLLDAAKKSRNVKLFPYLTLLLHTAMRPGEAAGLKWNQVFFKDKGVLLTSTKNHSGRWIPLTNTPLEMLYKLHESEAPRNEWVFLPVNPSKRLLLAPANLFRGAWKNARRRAGLEHVHLHDLRHTAASHLLKAGVDIRVVQEILGHKTLQMVIRYTHLIDSQKREALDKLDSLGKFGFDR